MSSVLFITKGDHAASSRYRASAFLPYLERAGWRAAERAWRGGLPGKVEAIRAAGRFDVVVLQRRMPAVLSFQALRRASRRLVFDFDDAVFANSDGSVSASRERAFARVVAASDAVWAGNAFLAAAATHHSAVVSRLPTAVDTDRYSAVQVTPAAAPTLAWIGSRSTIRYLEGILPALEDAARQVQGLTLRVIADVGVDSRRLTVERVPWSAEGEVSALASAHIGLAPLTDDVWSRGKCALKVLQYMAAGLPVISSRVGANADIVTAAGCGVLADDAAAWTRSVVRLAVDAAERRRLAAAGRSHCARHYDLGVIAAGMQHALEALL